MPDRDRSRLDSAFIFGCVAIIATVIVLGAVAIHVIGKW